MSLSLSRVASSALAGARIPHRERDAPRRRRALRVCALARGPIRLSANKKKKKLEKQRDAKSKDRESRKRDATLVDRVNDAEHEARRWLGQHFLIDASVVTDAVEAARLNEGDRVLEIGPGTGNLTCELLSRGANVLAVEKDRNLAEKLRKGLCVEHGEALRLVEGDFLKWDGLAAAFARTSPEQPRAKVVANIPYNITTDVLKVLLPMGDVFEDMIFMFQEEVAQRLVRDDAGGGDYRAMSVRVHYYSKPYYIRFVPPTCFMPPPNVDSCLIGFKPKEPHELLPLNGTENQFFTFVQACFAQKRKMLRNNLKAVCEENTMEGAFAMLDRGDKIRPQELTMEEYVRLFNFVRERAAESAPSSEQ
ncbi:Ribosomal RNA adenine methylase transferase,conserved site [Ostreococcus tauri]|jgi:ribosomal RNA small subunit methyltransferase A|uniref:rRNA adenine N(6)-methyltransferase n=1 Tax=Ostreococcus tauri TaxID=70448 RepID=Q012D3_OSTTA|nr:Ribosomal RNA adenine methylase transferase,conserved site [Ostreococcus tauri]CAL55247.1 Ribosomal RNA adenine methylase transferase,conserved site [Ostreococcus tauri]|eukprot:XP_003081078.1 Ribosomal RNA adenine methylase transferase,conserved site [Ostreococcus tauri]